MGGGGGGEVLSGEPVARGFIHPLTDFSVVPIHLLLMWMTLFPVSGISSQEGGILLAGKRRRIGFSTTPKFPNTRSIELTTTDSQQPDLRSLAPKRSLYPGCRTRPFRVRNSVSFSISLGPSVVNGAERGRPVKSRLL